MISKRVRKDGDGRDGTIQYDVKLRVLQTFFLEIQVHRRRNEGQSSMIRRVTLVLAFWMSGNERKMQKS